MSLFGVYSHFALIVKNQDALAKLEVESSANSLRPTDQIYFLKMLT